MEERLVNIEMAISRIEKMTDDLNSVVTLIKFITVLLTSHFKALQRRYFQLFCIIYFSWIKNPVFSGDFFPIRHILIFFICQHP